MNRRLKSLVKTFVPMPVLNKIVRLADKTYDVYVNAFSGGNSRKVLTRLNPDRLRFFDRAKPVSKCYPYELHNSDSLREQNLLNDGLFAARKDKKQKVLSLLNKTYLVGRNWKNSPEKPIAVCFAFNDWKLGFMSEYLSDYRCIFIPRTLKGSRAHKLCRLLNIESVFVWGFNEPNWLTKYTAKHKLKITRVEDGFVRSALLGAARTTPYSLVFDDMGGMHYNTQKPNRLNAILNTYDFSAEPDLLNSAKDVCQLIIDEGISKYNQPTLVTAKDTYSIKTRKRILVLGQVEKDAAIRLGNPDNWTMLQMIQLAKLENPDAEIIYKPHPEVYAGYQKSILRARQFNKYTKTLPPDVPMHQALEGIDHVYTITSLSGLEALIRGIKVTTLGTAFYGGWGLTDDRCQYQHRGRKLSLTELFAGIYLKYPRYLADLNDPIVGLKAAILRIGADKEVSNLDDITDPSYIARISKTMQWPQLVLHPKLQTNPHYDLVQSKLDIGVASTYTRQMEGELAKLTIIHHLCGWLESEAKLRSYLNSIRDTISLENFSALLARLKKHRPTVYLMDQYTWLLDRIDQADLSAELIQGQLKTLESSLTDTPADSEDSEVIEENALLTAKKDDEEKRQLYTDLLASSIMRAEYEMAIDVCLHLLLLQTNTLSTLYRYSEVAAALFDYTSCTETANFVLASNYEPAIHKAVTLMFSSVVPSDHRDYVRLLALHAVVLPGKAVNTDLKLQKHLEPEQYESVAQILKRFLYMSNEVSIGKIQGWIAANNANRALEVLNLLNQTHDASPHIGVAQSQALSFAGQIDEAQTIISETLNAYPISIVYREAMRICVLKGDYQTGLKLLRDAQKGEIYLGDMTPRKIYFGARMPYEALETFRDFFLKQNTRKHYRQKYCDVPNYNKPDGTILFLPIFGPGDELRFASIYRSISEIVPHKEIYIGCEARLEQLFSRSFPSVNFVPIQRLRGTDRMHVEKYDKLASSALIGALDNNGVEALEQADEFALVTDMLAEILQGYDDFKGVPYLKADPKRVKAICERLPKGKPLVGLSWRSSLNTHSRTEHYLSIEELAPVLEIEGVQFVNLQYDECDEELAWAEEHFPGKIINLEDIDQYNDFDSVAALMKSLDLVIAPATTVVELAGALGCPTWLLSNSSELYWREINDELTDVWHHSITHVKGNLPKDKLSLVKNLAEKLSKFSG